jgi:hypothetical protein
VDSRHRYFRIAQTSDTQLALYRARLSLIGRLWAFTYKAHLTGTALLIPLWVTYMTGAALVTSHFTLGRMLMTASLYFSGFYIGGLIASAAALAAWKWSIPVPGKESLLVPLEANSEELADMQDAGMSYPVCGAYLRAVEEQGRKLYQFDANYVAELAAVIERGEWPEAYARLALRN